MVEKLNSKQHFNLKYEKYRFGDCLSMFMASDYYSGYYMVAES